MVLLAETGDLNLCFTTGKGHFLLLGESFTRTLKGRIKGESVL